MQTRHMDRLPSDLCLKIFCCLDHQNLATVQQVCRKWRDIASNNRLWSNLFRERWGIDRATFYAPEDPNSWKDVYIVQDRCDRVGLALKIIREGDDYLLVHQGQIQRHLGSRKSESSQTLSLFNHDDGYKGAEESIVREEPCTSFCDKILFFLGDLEAASILAKRSRLL